MNRFAPLMGTLVVLLHASFASATFPVTFGATWDGPELQQILDDRYGVGVVNAATDYEGAQGGDAVVPYWEDEFLGGLVVIELAGQRFQNEMGWYVETGAQQSPNFAGAPVIDGIDDGILIEGWHYAGSTTSVTLPAGVTRFGLYLNPNGVNGTPNAPEGENFFSNRFYNDIGPDDSGAVHAPADGDAQVLIYNVSHLHQGRPTYLVAWEDLDAGNPISPTNMPGFTDNDYNDLVVEITADSPVTVNPSSFGGVKALFR